VLFFFPMTRPIFIADHLVGLGSEEAFDLKLGQQPLWVRSGKPGVVVAVASCRDG